MKKNQPEEPLLAVRDLSVEIASRTGPVRVLNGVRLQVRRGMVLGIAGESGSGKSMACAACMGLLPRHASVAGGSILWDGRDLTRFTPAEWRAVQGRRLSMIMQNPMASFNPVRTVGDHFVETLRAHAPISRRQAWEQAVGCLERIHLPRPDRLMKEYPYQLSGGMLQRVMIAIALSGGPDVLFADEPTTALDMVSQLHVLRELEELCRAEGTALVIVTHDLGVIAELADEAAVMLRGEIVETADVRRLFDHPRHPYTKLLMNRMIR